MELKMDKSGDELKLQFTNDITFDDYNGFRPILDELENNNYKNCVMDLRKVDYIDSAGLGMLLLVHEATSKINITPQIITAEGQVQRMLELAKFNTMFDIISN